MSQDKNDNLYGKVNFCSACGSKLTTDAVFCENCGHRIPTQNATVLNGASINDGSNPSESMSRSGKKGIIILSVCLGIFLTAAVVATVFIIHTFGNSSQNDFSLNDTSSYSYYEYYDNESNAAINDTPKSSSTPQTHSSPSQITDSYKRTCLNAGCDNTVSSDNYYCSLHKCQKSFCTSKKTYSSQFCSVHSCLEAGCGNERAEAGNYCSEHTCLKSYCTSQKAYNSNYCYAHKCSDAGCGNSTADYGQYCSEHTCSESGCSFKKSSNSNYCSSHECMYVSCHNRRDGYGLYCLSHTCAYPGCSSQKSSLSEYCLIHDD